MILSTCAGYLVAIAIGCLPLSLALLPMFGRAFPTIFGYAGIVAFPLLLVLGLPLGLILARHQRVGTVAAYVIRGLLGPLIGVTGFTLEALLPAEALLPGVYAWVGVSVAVVSGALIPRLERASRATLIATCLAMSIIGAVGVTLSLAWW
ncbi:hypothetical protein [Agromyces atrinae]|uniref:Uncharacterized protein n=1 Tax=Agromyces atrinae TaxID=592376 RepID=A0A4Q2MFF9_9MICO|nr:hypothetical protein [Agromyces atrinae]NYD67935.1 hypothetical protein [Agromyces atrinae]RXZ87900.1 hypothetical protein ESP50_01495 [Agromyces atrinae]